jgi:hypothetical protein
MNEEKPPARMVNLTIVKDEMNSTGLGKIYGRRMNEDRNDLENLF